jgi:hypothetical protein
VTIFSPLRSHPPPKAFQLNAPVEFDVHTDPRAIVDEAGNVKVCHLNVGADNADTVCTPTGETLKTKPIATHNAVKRFTKNFDLLFTL